MTLAGLPLTTLLGIGAAFGALTVLLYVLRLRRRPVPVPFTRLWQQVLSDKQSSSLFSRLRQLLSLLLQLLMVAALVLALGDPRPEGHRTEGRTFVVLLDASASMGATDVAPSRLEQAKKKALELVDGMAAVDRMLVVRMGATPTPLTTLTDDAAALKEAIESVRPRDTGADLDAALRLALDTLRGRPAPEIVLVSDGALEAQSPAQPVSTAEGVDSGSGSTPQAKVPEGSATTSQAAVAPPATSDADPQGTPEGSAPGPLRSALLDEAARAGIVVSYLPVGERGRNVAITQFAVRRYPLDKSRHEVLVELTNTSREALEVELSLHGDGAIIDVVRLPLEGGQVLRRLYSDLGGASEALEAEVRLADGTFDDLRADDRAFATLPPRRRARVLVVSSGNAYLEAALLLDEYLHVTEIPPAEYPPPGEFDVTIFDGVAPERVARTGAALYLGLPDEAAAAPVGLGGELEMFGFDRWDEKSPLLRWMLLPDIQVLRGRALVPQAGDRVLGESLGARGTAHPILVSGRRPEGQFVALGFDPRRSDFVLRVAWPLFLLNVIDAFTEESGEALSAYRTGTVWRVPVPESGAARDAVRDAARIRQPDGSVVEATIEGGHAVLFGDQAGFYELEAAGGKVRFAANLVNARESHVAPRGELHVATESDAPETVVAAGPVSGLRVGTEQRWWVLLLLGVVGLSLFEWLSYHRRWTV